MKHAEKNVFSFIHAASSLFSSQDILSILKSEKISNPLRLSSIVLFRNKY
jgi:hypothetical protein